MSHTPGRQAGRQAWVLCPELALMAVEGQIQNCPGRDSGLGPRNVSTYAPGAWPVKWGGLSHALPRPRPGRDDSDEVMQSQVWVTLRKTQLLYGAKLSDKTSGWIGGAWELSLLLLPLPGLDLSFLEVLCIVQLECHP